MLLYSRRHKNFDNGYGNARVIQLHLFKLQCFSFTCWLLYATDTDYLVRLKQG